MRSDPRHQHQPDPETIEQGDIVDETLEALVHHCLNAEADDKGLTTMGMDIGRGGPEPMNKLGWLILHLNNPPYRSSRSVFLATRPLVAIVRPLKIHPLDGLGRYLRDPVSRFP